MAKRPQFNASKLYPYGFRTSGGVDWWEEHMKQFHNEAVKQPKKK